MAVLDQLKEAIISGNRDQAKAFTKQALDEGVAARTIVVDGIAAAMALQSHTSVQQVDYGRLRSRLLEIGQVLERPA